MLVHRKKVEKDMKSAKSDWAAGNYYKAGQDTADLVTLALGPIN